jgi:hypothetical protein
MTEPAPRTARVPWYAREDYAAILAMMEDPHILAPVYDQWLAAAQNNEREAERAGVTVVRVRIEPESFARWCAEQGIARDSRARMRYVADTAGRGPD